MKKRIIIFLQILILFTTSIGAITQAEMEQARAITALWYLRYVNDGSDYLEKLSPTTIEELQKHLKKKEQENIKVFLKISIPTDFATWDKAQMVEYWSKTIFKNPDFPEKAQSAKRRIRSKLEAMEIAKLQENSPEMSTSTSTVDSTLATPGQLLEQASEPAVQDSSSSTTLTEESDEIEEIDEEQPKKSGSSTIIYIIILAVLVGIVVWLVVFALNTNKKSVDEKPTLDKSAYDKYIRELEKKDAEIAALKEKIQALNIRLRAAESKKNDIDKSPQQHPSRKATSPKSIVIYLGKANDKGVFIRADKEFNPEQSIYKLISTDGVTGSFGVIQNVNVHNHIRTEDVGLQNVCVGNDLSDLTDIDSISTINAGTAIFENGKWRVVIKAELRLT